MTLSSRIARLERSRKTDPKLSDMEAIASGVASLAQYSRVFAQDIQWLQRQVLGEAPGITAMEHAGLRYGHLKTWRAIAYPPDQQLDSATAEDLRSWELILREPLNPSTVTTSDQEWKRSLSLRDAAAGTLLVLGGTDAMGLRTRVWSAGEDGWQMSDEAWLAARSVSHYRHALHEYKEAGLPALCDHVKRRDKIGPNCYFTPADVAEHVGLPEFLNRD